MSNQDQRAPIKNGASAMPVNDASGKPVNVVERDIRDDDGSTAGVDKVITPTSTRATQQNAERLHKETSEVERKLADD